MRTSHARASLTQRDTLAKLHLVYRFACRRVSAGVGTWNPLQATFCPLQNLRAAGGEYPLSTARHLNRQALLRVLNGPLAHAQVRESEVNAAMDR
jgi:hypothetical protein